MRGGSGGGSSQWNGSSSSSSWNGGFNSGADDTTDWEGAVVCNCSIPGKRLTVQKEGPNKGREFYVCSKDRSEQCRFFKWADEVDEGGGGGGGGMSSWGGGGGGGNQWPSPSRGGGRGRGGGAKRKAPGEAPRKRKCGVCGEEGHNRKNCPQNAF